MADVIARLRRTSDGVVRDYVCSIDHDVEDGLLIYMWTEGNYSCDCNRALFFARAADEDDLDVPCGEKMFSLDGLLVDGEVITFEEPRA